MSAKIPFAILMTLHLSRVSTFLPQSLQFLIYSMQLKLLFLHVLQDTPRRPHMMENHTRTYSGDRMHVCLRTGANLPRAGKLGKTKNVQHLSCQLVWFCLLSEDSSDSMTKSTCFSCRGRCRGIGFANCRSFPQMRHFLQGLFAAID